MFEKNYNVLVHNGSEKNKEKLIHYKEERKKVVDSAMDTNVFIIKLTSFKYD